jgi:hypothetical protein
LALNYIYIRQTTNIPPYFKVRAEKMKGQAQVNSHLNQSLPEENHKYTIGRQHKFSGEALWKANQRLKSCRG